MNAAFYFQGVPTIRDQMQPLPLLPPDIPGRESLRKLQCNARISCYRSRRSQDWPSAPMLNTVRKENATLKAGEDQLELRKPEFHTRYFGLLKILLKSFP